MFTLGQGKALFARSQGYSQRAGQAHPVMVSPRKDCAGTDTGLVCTQDAQPLLRSGDSDNRACL